MSPTLAVGCWRTTTQSPLQIAASIIESPLTSSMKTSPSPTSSRGSGKNSSTACSARIGPPAAIRPTSGTYAGVGRADVHGARPVRVAAQEALLLQLLQLVGHARR